MGRIFWNQGLPPVPETPLLRPWKFQSGPSAQEREGGDVWVNLTKLEKIGFIDKNALN